MAPNVELAEELPAAAPEWSGLAREAGNIFVTPEWARTWWRHYGQGKPLVANARDGERRLLLPMYVARHGPARVLRLIGHGPADRLELLGDASLFPAASQALAGHVAPDALRLDLLVASRGGEEGERPAPMLVPIERESSPVLERRGRGWEAYLADRSANFREQVRRRERRLGRGSRVRFRLADDAATLPADLDLLFALHRTRWGMSSFVRAEAFHREFAGLALERGWLRLWILELDGSPVAAWYGFRFGETEAYYQAGRDPAHQRDAVGLVLLAHTIRAALEDGVGTYRFLRGGEAYKAHFADGDEPVTTWASARSALGAVLVAGWRAVARVRAVAAATQPVRRDAAAWVRSVRPGGRSRGRGGS
jgi:CelD/BcsL family acetyltransferase involved in cellulose biosynthesis